MMPCPFIMPRDIILLDELNTRDKLMWRLMENTNRRATDANNI